MDKYKIKENTKTKNMQYKHLSYGSFRTVQHRKMWKIQFIGVWVVEIDWIFLYYIISRELQLQGPLHIHSWTLQHQNQSSQTNLAWTPKSGYMFNTGVKK